MEQITLAALVEERGQAAVAKLLGVSPAAISKALGAARNILITELEDGTLEGLEMRRFPSQGATNTPVPPPTGQAEPTTDKTDAA